MTLGAVKLKADVFTLQGLVFMADVNVPERHRAQRTLKFL